jgi:hypothetical protein
MARAPGTGMRNASGLAWSRECSVWFWLSYVGLLAALIALLAAELLWRLHTDLSFYFIEALLLLISPFLVLMHCDQVTLRTYSALWYDLREQGRAPLLLDRDAVANIRDELRWHPLLGWLRPPPSRDVRGQLFTATLWYRAVMAPEGTSWPKRYSEQLGLALALLLLVATPLLWMFSGGTDMLTGKAADCATLALLAVALGWLAQQQLVVTSRRQAILDYFAVHLTS